MHQKFRTFVENLHPLLEKLISEAPTKERPPPIGMPSQGVYLFSEGRKHLYVGRSNNLRQRYGQHSLPGSQHNQAVFAFKIARQNTGKNIASYTQGIGSRKVLANEKKFKKAFISAKKRVRAMDYRYVEVTDQKQQTLLEIYCAIALNCQYNNLRG